MTYENVTRVCLHLQHHNLPGKQNTHCIYFYWLHLFLLNCFPTYIGLLSLLFLLVRQFDRLLAFLLTFKQNIR